MTNPPNSYKPSDEPRPEKPTILFVDDEERIVRSLKMMFRGEYRVETFTNGYEALEFLRHNKVHAVISDQRMPSITGVELLREVRTRSPNTMRLLLTGYSDLEAIVGSINEGEIFRYINKPWNSTEIRETVAKAVDIAISLDAITIPTATDLVMSGEHLLIIDDDPATATAIREAVEEEMEQPHIIEWASDIDSVFKILERNEIALVISEMHLGERDISPLLKTMKRYNPHVVTMVLTSFRDTGALVELINEGQVHRFLPKPVRKKLMAKSIRDALERYRAMKAAPELARRHQVEEVKKPVDASLSNRIIGFMRRLRA